MNLSIITLTSDRPIPFRAYRRWMPRTVNNYIHGKVQVVISDDGEESADTDIELPAHAHLHHIKREPLKVKNPMRSFVHNLSSALDCCAYDTVVFMEDDDWYSPAYLNLIYHMISINEKDVQILGENRPIYYHIRDRRYHVHGVLRHTSLSQTTIHGEVAIARTRTLLKEVETPFIDLQLWGALGDKGFLAPDSRHSVGIKGLTPGNYIGNGHNSDWYKNEDPDGAFLRGIIGEDDAAFLFGLAKEVR